MGRVRKKEKKGREVVSCRTLDEAHARCEAARAFTRGKQEAVCVPGHTQHTTVGPGPGGVHAVVLLPRFSRRIVASTTGLARAGGSDTAPPTRK